MKKGKSAGYKQLLFALSAGFLVGSLGLAGLIHAADSRVVPANDGGRTTPAGSVPEAPLLEKSLPAPVLHFDSAEGTKTKIGVPEFPGYEFNPKIPKRYLKMSVTDTHSGEYEFSFPGAPWYKNWVSDRTETHNYSYNTGNGVSTHTASGSYTNYQ